MDALSATNGRCADSSSHGDAVTWLARTLVICAFALSVLAGLLLVVRRLAGALVEPLDTAHLLIVVLSLVAVSLVFRRVFTSTVWAPVRAYLTWSGPSLMVVLWLAGLSLAGSSATGMVILFGILLLEEGWSWGRMPAPVAQIRTPHSERTVDKATQSDVSSPEENMFGEAANEPVGSLRIAEELGDLESTYGESESQSMIRRQEGGRELIEGWTRVDFTAGQRHAVAHLAICPPLKHTPVCYAEVTDGPPAEVKVTQSVAYGVRCEVKLDETAIAPTSIVIEFSIQEPVSDGETVGDDAVA